MSKGAPYTALLLSTFAFTVSFAVWMMNGVLVTFLIDHNIFPWDKAQMGWLIGIPVLTGALMRLPVGVLTDKYGGRLVFTIVMLVSAIPLYLISYADSYLEFLVGSLGFGLTGATFAVGVGYVSLWFPKEKQGTVLGVFGMGSAGTAVTSMGAPYLLKLLTDHGAHLDGWRTLPKIYAVVLVATAVLFFLFTSTRKAELGGHLTLSQRLAPLRSIRVWRFGLYYFFVFGGFVAVSQWLIPYFVTVYGKSVATAGLLAALFSLPAAILRAVGGWAADRWGARTIMYLVLSASLASLIFLFPPRMEIQAPGPGVLADRPGTVMSVTEGEVVVGQDRYVLSQAAESGGSVEVRLGIHQRSDDESFFAWPIGSFHQVPIVREGETVEKKQLLARGVTGLYFQANIWIFTTLVVVLGVLMGMGSGAVYKHIPTYFPKNVGVVGGLVGVIGGLGGFFGPIIFGYLLTMTGIWTTCWMFLAVIGATCLCWMHVVVRRMLRAAAPVLSEQIDRTGVLR